MELTLNRNPSTSESTISPLYVNGKFQCYILEDVVRQIEGQPVSSWKVYGKTAIPRGRYKIVLSYSQRFKRILPELINVDGYLGVRIHSGNTDLDTDGCLITGDKVTATEIVGGTSRPALENLINVLESAYNKNEPIYITIT